MLSIISITSLDQGKLFPKPKNEDEYFARYLTAADKAEPKGPQTHHSVNFPRFAWAGLLAQALR